jgi:hypothetical protein
MGLPTIESSYVCHTTRSIRGFGHPEYPALRVALEVLNATESYLWVRLANQATDTHALCLYTINSVTSGDRD